MNAENSQKLPAVNRELALKLMDETKAVTDMEAMGKKTKAKKISSSNLLTDSRFKSLFENPNFEIDKSADEYRYIDVEL